MRIHIKFVTKIKIDHEYHGVGLDEIYCDASGEVLFYYSVYFWNKVPELIQELLKSDIVTEMQKEIKPEIPISETEMKVKLQVLNSIRNV